MSIGLGLNLSLRSSAVGGIAASLPSFVDSARLLVLPHVTQSLWVESATQSTPETRPSIGSSIGCIADLSPCGNHCVTSTAGRLTLATDATRTVSLTGGASAFLICNNSTKSFTHFHDTSRAGSFSAWIKCGTDANLEIIALNNTGSAAQAGFYLARTAANKIQFYCADGAGNALFNHVSSTSGVTTDKGWMLLTINLNGDGNGSLQINNAAGTYAVSENFTLTAQPGAAAGTASAQTLYIGSTPTPNTNWRGSFGPIVILPTAMTTNQRNEMYAFNPERTNASLARRVASNNLMTDYAGLFMWFDGAGTTYFYQGQNRATAVTADGQDVRTWACRAPLYVNRDLDGGGGAGTYPKYKPTQTGGVGGLDFDGSNDNLTFNGPWPTAGDWHAFIVAKNDDQTAGSHFWATTNAYLALTGANYGSPSPGSTNPYAVNHCNNAGAVAELAAAPNSGGFNVHEVKREGQVLSIRTNGRTWISTTIGAGNANAYALMGNVGHGDSAWQLDGMVCELGVFIYPQPDSFANAIASQLGSKWSVANMSV